MPKEPEVPKDLAALLDTQEKLTGIVSNLMNSVEKPGLKSTVMQAIILPIQKINRVLSTLITNVKMGKF